MYSDKFSPHIDRFDYNKQIAILLGWMKAINPATRKVDENEYGRTWSILYFLNWKSRIFYACLFLNI